MQGKRLVLVLCFTLLFLSAHVQAEEVTGFRGMNWGDPLPAKGMSFVVKDPSFGGIDKYKRNSDDLKIGGAKLKSILYSYWNGKLCSVTIDCSGYANYKSLLDAFTEKFGKPNRPNQYIEEYYWTENQMTGIMLKFNSINNNAAAFIGSNSSRKEQTEWMKEQAKKGKKDF